MSEQYPQDPSTPPPPPPPPPPPQAPEVVPHPPGEAIPPEEINAGKALAIISYAINLIGLPFWILPLLLRDNAFSLYHAKQAMMLWITGVVLFTINGILFATVVLACVTFITWPLFIITLVVLDLIGLVNAAKGRVEPVPFVGTYAEQWFASIRKPT